MRRFPTQTADRRRRNCCSTHSPLPSITRRCRRTCTQSDDTVELLMEEGYVWNSNSFADDLPFVWENGASRLVELPRQPFGDGRLFGHQNRAGDHPDNALRLWKRFFNDLYAESAQAPMFTTFQLHPYVSSRLGRTSALKEMI